MHRNLRSSQTGRNSCQAVSCADLEEMPFALGLRVFMRAILQRIPSPTWLRTDLLVCSSTSVVPPRICFTFTFSSFLCAHRGLDKKRSSLAFEAVVYMLSCAPRNFPRHKIKHSTCFLNVEWGKKKVKHFWEVHWQTNISLAIVLSIFKNIKRTTQNESVQIPPVWKTWHGENQRFHFLCDDRSFLH